MATESKTTERYPPSALRRNTERGESAASAAADAAGSTEPVEALTSSHGALSRIAHDLNNVLQSIRNGAELLRRFEAADSEAGPLVDMVRRNAESAASLTAELLSLAQPEGAAAVPADAAAANPETDDPAITQVRLTGRRVLVIEDESLVAMLVEDFLDQLGCRVTGPIGNLDEGLDTARRADLDLALLDVNIRGQPVYPVADALHERGVPVVFMSGDQSAAKPWQDHPMVQKPFALDQLRRALEQAVQERHG